MFRELNGSVSARGGGHREFDSVLFAAPQLRG
jgi:hypothetical protein